MNPTTFAILPGIRTSMLTPEDLERIAAICRRFNIPAVKATSAQRLALLGVPAAELARLRQELNILDTPHHGHRVTSVQACPGRGLCRYATGDAHALGQAINNLEFAGPLPAKVKVGISGCRMCCCESWIRDVGLIAQQKGWKVLFGGNGAGRPRIGDVVAERLNDEEALALVEKCLNFYRENAKFKTRSARFMERTGIDALKHRVLD
ncbi:MAG: nitrite reductase [Desulfobulbaceae bacterium]